jgi:hypothetical protein
MAKKLKEWIISKEDAVFWLDKHGYWHNQHGKFQHKKIIDYFHSAIKKDKHGYYLSQIRDNFREKVYFRHEDTALFVFDVIRADDVVLVLNTKRRIKLKPRKLFIKEDSLYMAHADETIKFAEQGLMKISELLEFEDEQYYIRVNDRRYIIKNAAPSHPA